MRIHAVVLFNDGNPDVEWYRPGSGGKFFDYEDGDHLREVFQFDVDGQHSGDAAAELIYAITNSYPEEMHAPAEYTDLCARYRQQRLRSLSVGDILVLSEENEWQCAYAVAAFGFTELPKIPPYEKGDE